MTNRLAVQVTYVQTKVNLIREVDNKQRFVNTDNGTSYDLGEIGQVIWEILSMSATIDQIVTILTTEFEVTNAECRNIVTKFITELLAAGLIEVEKESR